MIKKKTYKFEIRYCYICAKEDMSKFLKQIIFDLSKISMKKNLYKYSDMTKYIFSNLYSYHVQITKNYVKTLKTHMFFYISFIENV